MRTDCPAFIMLRASKCGLYLEVIGVCNAHNHEISENSIKCLPQNRKLSSDMKQEVLEMMMLHIDRKNIIEYVKHKTGQYITSKNLFNLRASADKLLARHNLSGTKEMYLERINNVIGLKVLEPSSIIVEKEKFIPEDLSNLNDNLEEIYYVASADDNIVECMALSNQENEDDINTAECITNDVQFIENVIEEDQHFEYSEFIAANSDNEDAFSIKSNDNLSQQEEPTIVEQYYTSESESYVIAENQFDKAIIRPNIDYDKNEYIVEIPATIDNSIQDTEPGSEETEDIIMINDDFEESELIEEANEPISTNYENVTSTFNHGKRSKHINSSGLTRIAIAKRANLKAKQKLLNCRLCGSKGQMIKLQMDIMIAQKKKLIAEIKALRLTKKRLMNKI